MKEWVNIFVYWYNNKHLHSAIKFVTPNDKHNGLDEAILNKRKIIYETAKLKKPNRWSRETRNWKKIKKVYLNHLQKKKESDIKIAF